MTTLDLDQPIHDQIDALRKDADCTVPSDVREYYDGAQATVATPDQMAALGDRANRAYVENQLKRCTDVLASRLLFRRYLCEDSDAVQDALAVFATKNQMTEQMVTNTVRVIVDGNNAIGLSWDAESARPVMHQERWWDGEEGVYAEISDTGVSEWAVKEWTDRAKQKRRTVYLPDRILRFVQSGGWQPFGDDDTAIVPWTRNGQLDGEPLGVPVVHFGNTVTSDSFYGTSTLEPLLGLQDSLNGSLFDISAAGATNAFGIYTATGVDEDNTSLSVGPGRMWKTGDPNARFGLLNGSDMTPILDGYKATRAAIANQFPVPEHLIAGGQFPSGLALIKAESPMVGHVKLLGETFAPSWVLLAHRATELMNTFGGANLDEDAMIQIEYEPAEQLDEGTVIEIDRERVALYQDLSQLPKVLMLKTGLVDETEANAIIASRAVQATAAQAATNPTPVRVEPISEDETTAAIDQFNRDFPDFAGLLNAAPSNGR